ncbi:Alpha/Beta hydrolase protein [Plectosphaerella plurivora]|uniref:Alpha/Beta hydrolase protein n=1 Tax=Plectosphaerella plurivora TaxID=936078 RepID=A0A9P9ACA9_9PEZI|nr:Alpha/Beta hydrolase protein [Plectosphaerella plurivora]
MLSQVVLTALMGFAHLPALYAELAAPPTLELPWGVYQGRPMEEDPKPVSDGRNCIQVDPAELENAPGGENPIDTPEDQVTEQAEDCLFLDLYVPKDALGDKKASMPVVVWLYGGAFAFGSKNQMGPLYTGRSVITASKYKTIFVAGNYRVGAFGWLAGDYMQKEGQPNAGLHDQALLFQWVQEHIGKVSGDKSMVTAWGESAGAGSILHHLVREDAAVDPTFKTFAVQSPAFQWAWDNSPGGTLDQVYQNFSSLAGCGQAFDIDCLRKSDNLTAANFALFKTVGPTGLFPVGPAVDGKWIKNIPTISFARGNYWKSSIRSAIVSHCLNEPVSFIPKWVNSQETFTKFLQFFLPGPGLEPQRQKITSQYPCDAPPYGGNYKRCLGSIIQDASFTCNTRDLYSAYPDKAYMMRYGYPLPYYARHASDLVSLFSNTHSEVMELLAKNGFTGEVANLYSNGLSNTGSAKAYQSYFASFALSGGDPNTLEMPEMDYGNPPKWPVADGSGDQLKNVLTVQWNSNQPGYVLDVPDDQNSKKVCAFWTKIAEEVVGAQKETKRLSKEL